MVEYWNEIKDKLRACCTQDCWNKIIQFIKVNRKEDTYHCHLINLSLLLGSYIISSFLIYPELNLAQFIKELFALLCVYGALFCWFTEKFSENNILRICLITTTFLAPVIFINNAISVAMICLFLMAISEYICLSYIQGHKLFSKMIPVYIICETEEDLESAYSILPKYKTLELIVLSEVKLSNFKLSRIRDLLSLDKHLGHLQYIPFFPVPRKIIYCSTEKNLENYLQLLEIATKYSISVITVANNTSSPVTISNLFAEPVLTDNSSLMNIFKNKNIWICYDGRRTVLDLICILSKLASVNLTIICESECLMAEIDQTLTQINSLKNYRIKIVDLSFLIMNEARPDILFYNMKVKNHFSDEDHLKEALIKNVIDTDNMVQLAQKAKIPLTFVLSSTNAAHLNNWTGATQRLGELLCQHADFQCRKTAARFKAIRIPDNIADPYGFLGKLTSSILYSGKIIITSSENDLNNLYKSEDIITLLLKAIMLAYKSEKTALVLTIMPKDKANPTALMNQVCNTFGLSPEKDITITYDNPNDVMELDTLPNIAEALTKTSILNIFSTKFVTSSIGNYDDLWTEEQISKMNPREIIAEVFQSISNKINPTNR